MVHNLSQQDSNGATPLHYAVEADSLEAVEVLMRRPEVMDQPDLCGRTALMWAAAGGACDMIKAMCRHGSDLSHKVITNRVIQLARHLGWVDFGPRLNSLFLI